MLEKHKDKIAINSVITLVVAVFSWYIAYSFGDRPNYSATLDKNTGDAGQQQILFTIISCSIVVLTSWLLLVMPYFSRQEETPKALSSLLLGLIVITSTLSYLHGTWLLLMFMGGSSLFGV
jgi:hypothetical protein